MNNIKKVLYIVTACIILASSSITSVGAVYNEKFFSGNDILFYNPDDSDCTTDGTGIANLVGNGNQEKALRYLIGKGLTLAQASGIVGNLVAESRLMPARIQGSGTKLADENYSPISGVGFGIAQWTSAGRQQGLVSLSISSNRKIIDLSLQLDYLWRELSGSYRSALTKVKLANNPVDAAIAFHDGYEKSADSDEKVKTVRGGIAQKIYDQYSKSVPDKENSEKNTDSTTDSEKDSDKTKDESTDTSAISSDVISCTGNGTASTFIDGFAIYNQNDPQWNDTIYSGSTTIGEAGCGPSAMAMIITALDGTTVTPVDTAKYAAEQGLFVENEGSSHAIAAKLSEHWGLKSKSIGANVAAINEVLRSGGLILAVGNGSAPYTPGGHFIVIRAVTEEGEWLVGDSNGLGGGIANSSKKWDPISILVNGVDMWAITK
jgi:hypothetical protein